MRDPEPLQQCDRTFVLFRERKLSYFAGCDYFRMSVHKQVMAAFKQAAVRYGLNVAASRFTTGNHLLYQKLEKKLKSFFLTEDALLVSTGYLTNLAVAQGLAGHFSHVLIDEKSHPSLQDAAQMFGCPVLKFRHRDPDDLGKAVDRCGTGSKSILLTDGMFSHDGSVAPVSEYLKVLPGDSLLLVDDAHGAGVLGLRGRGTPEHCAAARRRIVQTITLSKSLGAYGGAVLSSKRVRRLVVKRSPVIVGSTPIPLPMAAAALKALELLEGGQAQARERLRSNTRYVRDRLRSAGNPVPDNPGPIIAIVPANARTAARIKTELLKAQIFPPFIKYPGGPPSGYFRFVISSEHVKHQLDALADALISALDHSSSHHSRSV